MILKIINIKPWCIKFSVDGQKYFIKQDDFEPSTTLYKFNPVGNCGHYNTERLKSRFGSLKLSDYFSNPYKRGITYKEINSPHFIAQIACDGFGSILGMSKDEVDFFVTEREKIRLEKRIAELERDLNKEKQKLNILLANRNNADKNGV